MQRLTSSQSKKRPTVSKVMLLTEVLKKPQIAANLGTFFIEYADEVVPHFSVHTAV